MIILVGCERCRQQYKVDDELVGKRVKCRNCGAAILVQAPPAEIPVHHAGSSDDVFAVLDGTPGHHRTAGSSAESQAGRCPHCDAALGKNAVVCVACGYDTRTGQIRDFTAAAPTDVRASSKRAKRFRRIRGSELANTIDSYAGLVVALTVVGGLAAWVVHLVRAGGFSLYHVIPIAVVLAVLMGVVTPLILLGIRIASLIANFEPRSDTYTRVLIAVMLPFGISLLCSSQSGENAGFHDAITGAWFLAPALFLYLFRADLYEIGLTAAAGVVSLLVGCWAAVLIASLLPQIIGPLYADALPEGPWVSLATGHSPVVAATSQEADKTVRTPTGQHVASVETAHVPSTNKATIAPAVTVNSGIVSNLNDSHSSSVTTSKPPVETVNVPDTIRTHTAAGSETKPAHSLIFSQLMADQPEFQDVREVVAPLTPSGWMAVVKNDKNGTVIVQRWSIDPLARKGELSYQEVPKQPNVYALGPKGDALVVLSRFPRLQLTIASFDGKPARSIPLNEPEATPTLLGFTDPGHFIVRWDRNGQTVLQIWQALSGMAVRKINAEPFDEGPNCFAVSSNGRTIATANSKQIMLYDAQYDAQFTPAPKRISPILSTDGQCLGLAFSPDNSRIAIRVQAFDVNSILTFNVQTRALIGTNILPSDDANRVKNPPVANGLLWLHDGSGWLACDEGMFETERGRKIGDVERSGISSAYLPTANTVLMVSEHADGKRVLEVGRLDFERIRGQIEALKKH